MLKLAQHNTVSNILLSLLSLEKVFLQLPSYGSVGASCYQSSDLAPHYGDMRSAATTGNYKDLVVMLDGVVYFHYH